MQRNYTFHREKKRNLRLIHSDRGSGMYRTSRSIPSGVAFDSFGRVVRFLRTKRLIPSNEAFERSVLTIPQFTAASNQQTLGIRTDALALQIIYGHIADLNVLTHLHDT